MDGGVEDVSRKVRDALAVDWEEQLGANLDAELAAIGRLERTELAAREANGISVELYWTRATNVLTVTATDATTGDYFELVLSDEERPLDVYYHPFAYARARGLELLSDRYDAEVALDA